MVSTSDVSRAGRTRYEQRGFSLKGEIGIPLLTPPEVRYGRGLRGTLAARPCLMLTERCTHLLRHRRRSFRAPLTNKIRSLTFLPASR